jgi:nickel-dependent lactate racemase
LELDLPKGNVLSVLQSRKVEPASSEAENVRNALCNPVRGEPLLEVASRGRSVCILVSDYTRAAPNRVLIQPILEQLRRRGRSPRDVRILVAYGLHKLAPEGELVEFLGKRVVEEFEVIDHDAEDDSQLMHIGRTSFGTEVWVNKIILDSDLVIMTGLIEPHFFAGYSGGRKSILPGVAGRDSVYQNHSYNMIAHPMSRYGMLNGNPIHKDMIEAAKMAAEGRGYIVNVVMDKEGRIAKTFAGDMVEAHRAGVEYLNRLVRVKAPRRAGIVITSNGGYPLDRDLYQAVKGMATGRIVVKQGGVIIIFSECLDGVGRGHEFFFRLMAEAKSPERVLERIRREEPIKDQWEAQILAQIVMRANVILVSNKIKDSLVEEMHLIPAQSPEEALELAEKIAGKEEKIIAIPEGPYVIPDLTR